ncbi:C2 calcium-dependent membrane targeting [Corchorus capsularis]|uniref:C2 calcium-dependent membrane targeting n=1 Tax=Corchorus capsularis TaxID=210143 RepID=A0A1R3IW24_COCAP|nr:C2 calcium-dependent membrane targeting [Corchorus capsularis]
MTDEPITRPLEELDTDTLLDLLPDIPLWVKCPDYERVDWLNKFVADMWPYLDQAICATIRSMTEPMFAEYIGKFQIEAIEFDHLSLGTLPPEIHGLKVCETNENELVLEPAVRWAGNPNIVLVVKLLSLRITIQLVDLQISAVPRVTLKPLVPTIPCFANIVVSLLEKPEVDFGMSILGGDIMAIPGLYHFVQKTIKKQVAILYHWPQTLEIPILDSATVAVKKPVGMLHVKVVRAQRLLKKDILGTSDPYVKLNLTGESLPAKKTIIKKRNLNPEWNEKFKLIVKDPQSQVLQLQVFDWDKVGNHDRLGMQLIPLKLLTPYETKEFNLDLLKHTHINDPHDKKQRGKIAVELTYAPFREESMKLDGPQNSYGRKESGFYKSSESEVFRGAGLLSVMIQGAEDVEGEHHNNPYALVLFRGDTKKTKMIKRTRNPLWNDEFQFMLEEPPLNERIHIEVMSKRAGISFRSKESLGHVDINLNDVVHNGRINHKYHLINSKNGVIHVEIKWTTV